MKRFAISLLALMLIFTFGGVAMAAGANGTTMSATITYVPTLVRTWSWDIQKSVDVNHWDLFNGDQAVSQYTVAVQKTGYNDMASASGVVTITNGGAVATENLTITVRLTAPPSTTPIVTVLVDTSAKPVLNPGETYAYPYTISFSGTPGVTYKATADITITNHSGHLDTPFGPNPSATATAPGSPTSQVNDTVNVTDTNGQSWIFSNSGSASYPRTFTVADVGNNHNIATIVQTGQSSSADVSVNVYDLTVSKTAQTSYIRTFNWTILKTGDQTALNLALNQAFPVNYTVTVDGTYVDSNFSAAGVITVRNNAPIPAIINGVEDVLPGAASVNVQSPVSFPYTLAAGDTLTLTYTAALPDASARVNTATATLQNFLRTVGGLQPLDTTQKYSGTADVVFGAPTEVIDENAAVTDDKFGALGNLTGPAHAVYHYTMSVGPYAVAGNYLFTNTATVTATDTNTSKQSSWTVTVTIPTSGYTLTIGYWKNHAGFGPQQDMVTKLLPLWLGTPGGTKSVLVDTAGKAVTYLGMGSGPASNGIVKLYAQLLAAKLNIKNGADPSAVSAVISNADLFLASNNVASWDALSKANKNLVLGWMSTLDQYNNGIIGPGHASQ